MVDGPFFGFVFVIFGLPGRMLCWCVVWFVLVGFWAFHGLLIDARFFGGCFCGEFDPGSG